MIKKLETKEFQKDCGAFGILIQRKVATPEEMHEKINELVDEINTIKDFLDVHSYAIHKLKEQQNNRMIGATTYDKLDGVMNPVIDKKHD